MSSGGTWQLQLVSSIPPNNPPYPVLDISWEIVQVMAPSPPPPPPIASTVPLANIYTNDTNEITTAASNTTLILVNPTINSSIWFRCV
jgi:hypothetical protein